MIVTLQLEEDVVEATMKLSLLSEKHLEETSIEKLQTLKNILLNNLQNINTELSFLDYINS